MKEIDYIFKNLDTRGFLDQLKEWSGEQAHPGHLVLENVKNSNDEISHLLDRLIYRGIFFQKVKDFSLIYHGYSGVEDDEDDYASISCFFSKTDNKYWLLFYSYGEVNYFYVDAYENKPSIQKIKDVLKKNFNLARLDYNFTLHNFEDDTMIDLDDQEKEYYKDKINLEREDK